MTLSVMGGRQNSCCTFALEWRHMMLATRPRSGTRFSLIFSTGYIAYADIRHPDRRTQIKHNYLVVLLQQPVEEGLTRVRIVVQEDEKAVQICAVENEATLLMETWPKEPESELEIGVPVTHQPFTRLKMVLEMKQIAETRDQPELRGHDSSGRGGVVHHLRLVQHHTPPLHTFKQLRNPAIAHAEIRPKRALGTTPWSAMSFCSVEYVVSTMSAATSSTHALT